MTTLHIRQESQGGGKYTIRLTSKRLARASGAVLLPASRPFSIHMSSASEQIGLQWRETGDRLVEKAPGIVPAKVKSEMSV